MTELGTVLDQFQHDLRRVRHLLRLIKEFRSFAGSQMPEEFLNGAVSWPEVGDLVSTSAHVRTDLPVLSGSLFLYLCGRFEYFVREVVVSLADEVAANVRSYAELPERLRKELKSKTAEIVQSPSKYGYADTEVEKLIITLGKNLNGEHEQAMVTIESRILSITDANMNSQTLADIFRRIALNDIWVNAGKQAKLKTHLQIGDDKACANEAKSRLDGIMKDRNKIAHPTEATSFPGPEQVLSTADYLDTLAQVVVDLAKVPR